MTVNVVIYANCHGVAFQKYLYLYPGHDDLRITCLENYKLTAGILNLDDFTKTVMMADKFVYQPLAAKWGRLSTVANEDNIIAMLKPGCDRLSFPYSYNDALWPLIEENGNFVRNHEALDVYLDNGASCADLIELYDNGQLDFHFSQRMKNTIDYIRFMERDTDVKIAEFVEANILDRHLFTTLNHPTNQIFTQMLPRVADFIFSRTAVPATDLASLSENYAALPGYLPLDRYSIDDLGIRFKREPDENAAVHYRSVIWSYCARRALAASNAHGV